jgi:myosin heavy subunit
MKAANEIERSRAVGLFDWAKPDMPVWILNKKVVSKIEMVDYQKAVIKEVRPINKKVLVVLAANNAEQEYIEGMVFQRIPQPSLVNDLIEIPILNEAEILSHFELIFKNDEVYCYCGPALIAINPYRSIPKTVSPDELNLTISLLQKNQLSKASPHVWTVSAVAYKNLAAEWKDQSICINGESGSGKTESIKKCLNFLAAVEQRKNKQDLMNLSDRILACNPILESFGNCTTQNNDNSSRFGKYLQLIYSSENETELIGAQMESYLLEKSRVVTVGDRQRSFHIFYAMCRASPLEFQDRYLLSRKGKPCSPSDFAVFSKGLFSHKNIDDTQIWKEIVESFKTLEFSDREQDAIFRILSAVMHIGNFQIDKSKYEEGRIRCSIIENMDFNNAVKLLSCSPSDLQKALTAKVRIIKERGEPKEIITPHSPESVKHFCNSMAKELYAKLFNWLFRRLNSGIKGTSLPLNPKHRSIGLLDIYGFEIDEINTLDQLFINYTNEQLQNIYISHVFKNECLLFEQQGLEKYISLIQFQDNVGLIKAIDSVGTPLGLFGLLNQVCVLNQTDNIFLANLQNLTTEKNVSLRSFIMFGKMASGSFIVKHSAKDVEYSVTGFVDSNKDEVPQTIVNVFLGCLPSIAAVYREVVNGVEAKIDLEPTNVKDRFTTTKFTNGINSLVDKLTKNDCHFVRCIKPNNDKIANVWKSDVVLRQITYMGLLDSLKIRKFNYHIRYSYEKFYETFQDLDKNPEGFVSMTVLRQREVSFKNLTENLLKTLNFDLSEKEILFGRSMVFMNDYIYLQLEKMAEELNELKKAKAAILINYFRNSIKKIKIVRVFKQEKKSIDLARDIFKQLKVKLDYKHFRDQMRSVVKIQRKYRKHLEKTRAERMQNSAEFICKYAKVSIIKNKLERLLKAKRGVKLVHDLLIYQTLKRQKKLMKRFVNWIFGIAWDKITYNQTFFISTTIQRHFRSYLLRKKHQKVMEELVENHKQYREKTAAVSIQAAARGYLVRRRLARLTRSASKIQGFWRQRLLRAYFLSLRKNSVKIQRAWRRFKIRRDLLAPDLAEIAERMSKYSRLINAEYEHLLGPIPDSFIGKETIDSEFKAWVESGHHFRDKFSTLVPPEPGVQLDSKARLCTVLLDISFSPSVFDIYPKTWSKEVATFMAKLHAKNERILHFLAADSCTYLVTDELRIYSFGMNDSCQTGFQPGDSLYRGPTEIRHATRNQPSKIISRGNQIAMITQSGIPFFWGEYKQAELCIGSTRDRIDGIIAQNSINEEITDVGIGGLRDSEGKKLTTLLGKSGKLYIMGTESQEKAIQKAEPKYKKSVPKKPIEKGQEIDFYDFENPEYLYNAINNQQEKKKLGEPAVPPKIKILAFELGADFERSVSQPKLPKEKNNDAYRVTPIPNLTVPPKILSISCGADFSILLLDKGLILGIGDNEFGQLGVDDTQRRETLVEVKYFRNQKERVSEISCGYKHVIVRTLNHKVFVWGAGHFHQNGTMKRGHLLSPTVLYMPKQDLTPKASPVSVQATAFGNFLLFNDNSLFAVGKTGMGVFMKPTKIPYNGMIFDGKMKEEFIPIKLSASWSNNLSILAINFVDYRGTKNFESVKSKISDMLLSKWKPGLLLPYFDNNCGNYLKSMCFLKGNPRLLYIERGPEPGIKKQAQNNTSGGSAQKIARNSSRGDLNKSARNASFSRSISGQKIKDIEVNDNQNEASNATFGGVRQSLKRESMSKKISNKFGDADIKVSNNFETPRPSNLKQTPDARKSQAGVRTSGRSKSAFVSKNHEMNSFKTPTNANYSQDRPSQLDTSRNDNTNAHTNQEKSGNNIVILTDSQMRIQNENENFESKLKRISQMQNDHLKHLNVKIMNPNFANYSRSKSAVGIGKVNKSFHIIEQQPDEQVSDSKMKINLSKNSIQAAPVPPENIKIVQRTKAISALGKYELLVPDEIKNPEQSVVAESEVISPETQTNRKSNMQRKTSPQNVNRQSQNVGIFQNELLQHSPKPRTTERNILEKKNSVSREPSTEVRASKMSAIPAISSENTNTRKTSPVRISNMTPRPTKQVSIIQANLPISEKNVKISTTKPNPAPQEIIDSKRKSEQMKTVERKTIPTKSSMMFAEKDPAKKESKLENVPRISEPKPPKVINPQIQNEVDKIIKKDPNKWTNIDKEIMASYASLVKKLTK